MKQFNNRKSHKGFTLIEILVAIAIIGVLAVASITMINPLEQIKKSRDAQRKQDLRQLQIALEAYNADNNLYPAADGQKQISGAAWGNGWLPYIAKVPKDPVSTQSYRYESDGRSYRLHAKLENCKDPQIIGDCAYFNYQVTSSNVAIAALPTPIPTPTPTIPPTPTLTPTPDPTIPPVLASTWGGLGTDKSQFDFPSGVAVDSNFVYVADTFNHRIQKFDLSGNFLLMWGLGVKSGSNVFEICDSSSPSCRRGIAGVSDGALNSPRGVAVDSNFVYVADTFNHRIQKFIPSGSFLAKWGANGGNGTSGSGGGEFNRPFGVGIFDEFIYVADSSNNRIQRLDLNGNFQQSSNGLSNPSGVATNIFDRAYVADTNNSTIRKFGVFFNLITSWGSVTTPFGIAVDISDNYVYVADTGNSLIKKFTSSGSFLTQWGVFSFPQGIAVDSSNNVYVADSGNNRIQKFSPPPP